MKSNNKNAILPGLLAVASIAIFASLSSAFGAKSIEDRCRPIGGQTEQLCDVSIYAVISNPARFDGAEISLIGFYSEGSIPVLFVNKTAYEVSDVSSGIFLDFSEADAMAVDLVRRSNRRYLLVIGTFSKTNKPTYEVRGFATSGTIKIKRVGLAPGPWGSPDPPPSPTKR